MSRLMRTVSSYISSHADIVVVGAYIFIVAVFFYRTFLFGLLPIPTDALAGLYHPYRDLYAAQNPNGIPFKNFLITDPVRQQIPWRKTVIDQMKQGHMPLWDAYSFSGVPLLANIQSGAFYVLNILFFLLPFHIAWTALIISQPLLAGLFMYWFLRNKKLEYLPSLFGSICFAFSGFSLVWLTWGTLVSVMLWIPLELLAIDQIGKSEKKNKAVWILIYIFSICSSFFAGHAQIFLYSTFVSLCYWLSGKPKGRSIMWICFGVAAAMLLVSFQLVRMYQWLSMAGRISQGSSWQNEGFFIPLMHLVQFIAPDYFGNPATLNYWGTWNFAEMVGYIGIAGLAMALVGMSSATVFWIVTFVVSLLFSVASPFSELPFVLRVPLISSLQPTRLLVLVDLSLSILSAYGLSRFINMRTRRFSVWVPPLFIVIVLGGLWISVLYPGLLGITPVNALVSKRNLVLPSIFSLVCMILLISAQKINKEWLKHLVSVIFIGILLIDVFRFGWKFTPFTETKYFFPETSIIRFLSKSEKPFRVMSADDRIFPPDAHAYYGIESIDGYDPIHTTRYEEFVAAMEHGSSNTAPPYGYERIMVPKSITSPLLDLLNVRYILTFDQYSESSLKKVMEEGKTKVYERVNYLPRAYLVEKVIQKKDNKSILDALLGKEFHLRTDAVVENPIEVLALPLALNEVAVIHNYQASSIAVSVTTNMPRLLVITNMYNQGWHAYVDDLPAAIYRTNYLFIGIVIPSGIHEVSLRYQ